MTRSRSFWGWGYEGEGLSADERQRLAATLSGRFGRSLVAADPPRLDDLDLPPPRLSAPPALADVFASDPYERARHTYGRSYRDVVRGFRGEFARPPDLVAFPASEADVGRVLDWGAEVGAAVIPYGGGSSVVGGVETDVGPPYRGVVTLDTGRLDEVVELDRSSRAGRVQAGVLGPHLEDQLRPHGLTLRHFPQSFEFSSLGGWIATRSGGHFATVYTHIDDLVEAVRMVTPSGVVESRRLPGSGAGPSPDRLVIGSEGILGVVTEAWVRLQDRPVHRSGGAVRFPTFEAGVAAARALAQSGLFPTNCRLLDPTEALTSGADDGSAAVLLVGFESADHRLGPWAARAAELCADHGGQVPDTFGISRVDDDSAQQGSVGAWRRSFMRAPYLRDALVSMGVICETFETAITWERFDSLYTEVMSATRSALEAVGAGEGWVTCRFTHVYPDGPAPYFSVLAPGRVGSELEQWAEIKGAASEAVLGAGGTITHHHAVGRDHRPWYDKQRPEAFARALAAAKAALDPAGILNPGVLIDPVPSPAP
jgi:alkyldihydroxyacetonephosphate synthase